MKRIARHIRNARNLKVLVVALISLPVYAENYATCLLEKLPDLQNDVAAYSVIQVCMKKYPGGYLGVEKGAGRGFFAEYSSGAECTIDKAKDTRSNSAGAMIGFACRYLYDEPAISSKPDSPAIKPWEEKYELEYQSSLPPSNQSISSAQVSSQKQEMSQTSMINHYEKIYSAHPDADNISNSENFQQWIIKTSNEKILQNGNTEEVILLFSEYKAQLVANDAHSNQTSTQEKKLCTYKAIMTNNDYYQCGIKPPN